MSDRPGSPPAQQPTEDARARPRPTTPVQQEVNAYRLGEAQTCHVIRTVAEFNGSWWVSDDRDALEYARNQRIQTYQTVDVMRMIVADGDLSAEAALQLMRDMVAAGRNLFVPATVRGLQ